MKPMGYIVDDRFPLRGRTEVAWRYVPWRSRFKRVKHVGKKWVVPTLQGGPQKPDISGGVWE